MSTIALIGTVPDVFTSWVQNLTAERSAFVQSGVMETSPLFDQLLVGQGSVFELPFFQDLTAAFDAHQAANISDDTAGAATPLTIRTGREQAVRHSRNQTWSSNDLAAAIAGADPMEAIASRVADYWVREEERMLTSTLIGVLAFDAATAWSDATATGVLTNDISTSGAITDANLWSAEAFIDTIQTMGENGEDLVAMSTTSTVYRRMQKLNLIDFIPDSQGVVNIPTFQGLRVIVSDGIPTGTNGGNTTFRTWLFGGGAVARGVGQPKVPTEVDRDLLFGAGSGQEILANRVEWVLHPRGFQYTGTSIPSPTNTALETAGNWGAGFDVRGQVRFAQLITNG